jgi:Sigma-70 region 2
VYEELRPLLFSIADQMVGSTSDAEDIVQEAFLRLHHPVAVVSLDIADDLVQTVRTITNPEKLRHLSLPTDPD